MKAVVLFVICFLIDKHAAHNELRVNEANTSTAEYESYLDIVRRDIVSHSWEEDEKPCLNQIIQTIDNVKNSTLWATWIWDSIQFPVGQLYGVRDHYGNYDQCLSETVGGSSLPFRTQYCRTSVVWRAAGEAEIYHDVISPYAPLEEYIQSRSTLNLRFNELSWGVCVPENCEMKSVKNFVTALVKQTYLNKLQTSLNVTVENCELAGEATQQLNGHFYVLFVVFIAIVLVTSSTIYISKQNEANSSCVGNILKCFCLKRNTKSFFNVNENEIKILNGIRFLSCSLIVLTHSFTTILSVSAAFGFDQEELFISYGSLVSQLVIVVDTFFLLSGFLMMRNIKTKRTIRGVAELIIKRYFRLIWWYIATLLIVFFVLPRYGCGPLCDKYMQRERGACLDTWWLGLLMVANYIDIPQICYPSSWYMYCDFHLSVVSVVLLWIYQHRRRTAIACFSILATLSVMLPALAVYYDADVTKLTIDFQTYDRLRKAENIQMLQLYMQTHNRAIPYMAGMMLGYIMTKYKDTSSKRTLIKTLYVFLAIIVAGICLYPLMIMNDNLKNTLMITSVRFVWALCLSILICLCEYGKLPTVEAFLSCSVFAPLSKLTYGIYFIHYVILSSNMISVRGRLHVNFYVLMEKFLGNLTMAAIISLLFFLFIESPLNNLVKLLLSSVIKTERKLKVKFEDENKKNITNEATTDQILDTEKEKQL